MADKARVAVMVSSEGTNLQALIDAEAKGALHSGTISLVISSKPGVFALERAQKVGIPTAVASRKELGTQIAFEDRIQRLLEENQII